MIPGSGRSPGEGNCNPPVFLPGESHGWRSLVGYSPWGRRESDTTEQPHFTSKRQQSEFGSTEMARICRQGPGKSDEVIKAKGPHGILHKPLAVVWAAYMQGETPKAFQRVAAPGLRVQWS